MWEEKKEKEKKKRKKYDDNKTIFPSYAEYEYLSGKQRG